MVDKSRKGKKGSISEESLSVLLQRYPAPTLLTLLQEVAQVAGEKIDWRQVVKNTATGISGAREYQMLWRHLAYGETLADQLDDDATPMDDDSDLEYEMEAFPAVGREASIEATACVKVLIASGCLNDSHASNNNSTVEAPLTVNIPSSKALAAPSGGSILNNSTQGSNISISVTVQKQPLSSGTSGEKRPNNGPPAADTAPRRKRRAWSTEEDMKLTAAVQKYGERNWANIAKGDFKNDRKASELSQRWTNLRKKQGNATTGTNPQLSETQLAAAHRAMSLALNMPMGDNLKTAGQIGADQQLGRAGPAKSQVPTLRPQLNSISTPDSKVKAAAVAAGARIATSADASSLIEAARSQNVVHITTGGSPAIKSSPTGVSTQLPSNVHFIRNGLAKAPISTYTAAKPNITRPVEAQPAQGRVMKPGLPAAQPSPAGTPPAMNVPCGLGNATTSISSAAALPKAAEDAVASTSASGTKEIAQGDQGTGQAPVDQQVTGDQSDAEKHQPTASVNSPKENSQVHQGPVTSSGQTGKAQDDQVARPCSQSEDNGEKIADSQCGSKEANQASSSAGAHEDASTTTADGEEK